MTVNPDAVGTKRLDFHTLINVWTDNNFNTGFGFDNKLVGNRHNKQTG